MRFWSYLLVALFAESCSHTTNKAVNFIDKDQVQVDVAPASTQEDSKFYVPKIKFDTEVSSATVNETLAIMSQVTRGGAKAIIIEINTPGGEVESGFRLSKAIEESPIPVICVVDGMSASMGMYILESCQVRLMSKRSSLMVHEAAIGVGEFSGPAVQWQTIADLLKAINKGMAEHLAKRMHLTAPQILDIIRGGAQWWFGWEEAIRVGAVDSAVDSVKEVTTSYRECLATTCQP